MSRRTSYSNVPGSGSGARASIGDTHVSSAISALAKTQQATVALMTSYDASLEGTLKVMFDPVALQKLREVRGMVETVNIKSYALFEGVYIHLDYTDATVPAIEPSALKMQASCEPLLTFVREVKAIHDRFEEVKAVLRWLNRNATPGAIRYFWPTAMKLCPDARVWADLQAVPARYDTPKNISHWTQAIKDSAATVTGSLMLPTSAVPKPRRAHGAMWLRFEKRTVRLTGMEEYDTDQMLYHI